MARCALAGEQVKPDHELWLVSCRDVTTVSAASRSVTNRLKVWERTAEDRKWKKRTLDDLQRAGADGKQTCFWVHGDRMEHQAAFDVGKNVYQQLVVKDQTAAPVRFIVWSWPSAQELHGRPLKDARIKADRAGAASYCLGWSLNNIPPQTPVSLVGFSFGAKVLSGAVHLSGGGEIRKIGIPQNAERVNGYQVVLMAAAMDADALRPGGEFGQAMNSISELLLLNNYQDWVLKRYHRLDKAGSHALGYSGLNLKGALHNRRGSVRQVDAGAYIGKWHGWANYVYSDPLIKEARRYALQRAPQLHPPESIPSPATTAAQPDDATDMATTLDPRISTRRTAETQ